MLMNKWTLKFVSPQIEKQYQEQFEDDSLAFFKGVYSIIFSIAVIMFVYSLINDEQDLLIYTLIAIVYLISSYLIVKLISKNTNKYFLSFLNILITIQDSQCIKSLDALEGGLNMLISITLMGLPNFAHNSIVLIIIVALNIYFAVQHAFRDSIVELPVLVILFIYVMYISERRARKTFLLTLKDVNWINYFHNIKDIQYFFLEYDEEKMSFNSIKCKYRGQEEDSDHAYLRKFLRAHYVNNYKLEMFLFNKMKDLFKNKTNQTQLNQTIQVLNEENQKKFDIGVSILVYEKIQIIITITDSRKDLLIKKLKKELNGLAIQYNNLLKMKIDLQKKLFYCNSQDKQQLMTLEVYKNLANTKYSRTKSPTLVKAKKLNLFKCFKNIFSLYPTNKISFHIQNREYITTDQQIFALLLLNIYLVSMKYINKPYINVNTFKQGNYEYVTIEIMFEEFNVQSINKKLFQSILKYLGPKSSILFVNPHTILFTLYQNLYLIQKALRESENMKQ